MMVSIAVRLDARRAFRAHLFVIAALAAIHALYLDLRFAFGFDSVFGTRRLFDLGAESNIPTFVSALALLACSLVAGRIASMTSPATGTRRGWWVVAAIFAFLALDEAAQIHELSGAPVRAVADLSGVLRWTWVIPYALLTCALGAALLRWWLRLPPRLRAGLLLAAAVYLGSALLLEAAASAYLAHGGDLLKQGLPYALEVMIEEIGEMLGVAVALHHLLLHLGELQSTPAATAARFRTPEGAADVRERTHAR